MHALENKCEINCNFKLGHGTQNGLSQQWQMIGMYNVFYLGKILKISNLSLGLKKFKKQYVLEPSRYVKTFLTRMGKKTERERKHQKHIQPLDSSLKQKTISAAKGQTQILNWTRVAFHSLPW